MKMRRIQAEDKEEMMKMMRDFYDSDALIIHTPTPALERNFEACVNRSPYLEGFIFEMQDHKIGGYGMIAKSYSTEAGGECIWIEDLYLKEEYRGKGNGSLFFSFIQDLYGHKAARLRLEVEPDNKKAIEAYKKNGYTELGYMQMIKDRKF